MCHKKDQSKEDIPMPPPPYSQATAQHWPGGSAIQFIPMQTPPASTPPHNGIFVTGFKCWNGFVPTSKDDLSDPAVNEAHLQLMNQIMNGHNTYDVSKIPRPLTPKSRSPGTHHSSSHHGSNASKNDDDDIPPRPPTPTTADIMKDKQNKNDSSDLKHALANWADKHNDHKEHTCVLCTKQGNSDKVRKIKAEGVNSLLCKGCVDVHCGAAAKLIWALHE